MINKKLSILMPGYNEGARIYKNLIKTHNIVKKFSNDFEIIFINDGSTDDTVQQVKKAAQQFANIIIIDFGENHGKGNALKAGFDFCTGKFVAFVDSDLDLNPIHLKSFFKIMKNQEADVVIGSKMHPDSITNYPARRKFISTGYYFILKILFRLPIRDTQTGLKLFKYNALKEIFPKILVKKFAFDIELLSNIHHKGFKIAEAPIELNFQRQEKWGRIKLKDIYYVFIDTLAIFYRMYILKYYDSPVKNKINLTFQELAVAQDDGTIRIRGE